MDNLISGLIASVIFVAFVAGLAHSIGVLPFAIIVGLVIVMMLWDFVGSARAGLAQEKKDAEKNR